MTRTPEHPIESTVSLLHELRDHAPLVQCVTNIAVTNFTANVPLALGAVAAMVDVPELRAAWDAA
ncbi:hydroxyethylthiazole kinase [Microbacterium sp. NPDC087591]|uniref:hydroxyethylthiazole kinase n=1 Tax=Microbacterium sp. NPDC087591 TaxID=3364192 RepID=UPI0037FA375F